MKRTAHILILSVLFLAAAFSSILQFPNITHAQTAPALDAPVLTAAAQANAVTVSWTAVDGAARYELQRWEESAGAWVQIDDALTGASYTDSGVEAGKTYYYSVRALTDDGGESPWSDYSSEGARATVTALDAPVLTAAAQASAVTVSWTAIDGAARYELQRWEESAGAWVQIADALTGTAYTDGDVEAGKTYYYSLRALTADGAQGAWSDYNADNAHATVPALDAAASPDKETPETETAASTSVGEKQEVESASTSVGEKQEVESASTSDGEKQEVEAASSSDGEASESESASTSDKAALLALYTATDGANWKNNANWGSEQPLSAWHGVTTDANGRVTALEIYANGLSGKIPAELGSLTNLQILSLYANGLSGKIPVELGNLTNLWYLNLSLNSLSGGIPSALSKLGNLQFLDLKHSSLSGEIPAELGKLTNLKQLYLDYNQLNGEIPAALGQLTNLVSLHLDHNQLNGAIPEALGDLSNLHVVSLRGNTLRGCVPDALLDVAENDLESLNLPSCSVLAERAALVALYNDAGGASWTHNTNWNTDQPVSAWHGVTTNADGRVTALDLRSNGLTGEIPAALGDLTNLSTLYLSGNTLSGCVPDALHGVTTNDLDSLNLPRCSAIPERMERAALVALYNDAGGASWTHNTNWNTDQPVSAWHGVTTNADGRVTALDLYGNGLRGEIPDELGNLGNLTRLDLAVNQLSDEIPAELGNLSNLENLSLASNQLSGEIPAELGKLNNLDYLSLASNQLSDEIPSALGDLSNLTVLYLTGNPLRGCVPDALHDVTTNDLDSLNLPRCSVLATERAALIALYGATDGVNWTNNANWNTEQPVSAWHGVTTDANGRVTALDLRSNGLTGRIPAELVNLGNLSTLYLSGNSLSGCVPDALHGVTTNDLTTLNLPRCSELATERAALIALYGATDGVNWTNKTNWNTDQPVGEWFGVTTDENGNVTTLALVSNGLTGRIPAELGSLSNLTNLNLSLNSLSGEIPAELGQLTKLQYLVLDNNQLNGVIPAELGSLANLQVLYLQANSLSGTIPAQLGGLTNLSTLYLSGNSLRGCVPDALYDVATNDLTTLNLPRCSELATERAALIALYSATNGASWTKKTNWGSAEPVGEWFGVSTDENGNVTELSLSGNQLSGRIPAELGNLSRLTYLYLYNNSLSGTIPAQLGKLTNLQIVYLFGNQLSGTIPAELGKLANLLTLELSSNRLNGAIPAQLGSLTNLQALDLRDNSLSGAIPAELGNLGRLTNLFLANNSLNGCIPAALRNVAQNDLSSLNLPFCSTLAAERAALMALYNATNGASWTHNANWGSGQPVGEWFGVTTDADGRVTRLFLRNNQLSGRIPSELGKLTNLQDLFLNGNQLSGRIPSELGKLTNLQDLSLSDNQLSGAIPAQLGSLSRLQYLFLNDNQLSGTIPAELGSLANLQWLFLTRNQLSGTIPAELGKLTNLLTLDLRNNRLNGMIPAQLGSLTKLQILSLSGNSFSGCVPDGLHDAIDHDLDDLALPRCSVLATERAALITLYTSTNGANWTKKTNWNTDKPVSEWHGVTTDANGRVTALDLRSNGLTGRIPAALGDLTNLGTLYLSGNPLSGCVPYALHGVTTNDLDSLNLPRCLDLAAERAALIALYGATDGANWTNKTNWNTERPVGEWFGVTTDGQGRVTKLELSNNLLSGRIPSELGDLTELQRLSLSRNRLSGRIPAELGQLTKLQWLFLFRNQLSGAIPSELGNLTKLQTLFLDDNRLSGAIPSELGNLTNLATLYLEGNLLHGCVPDGLFDVSQNDLRFVGLPRCSAVVAAERAALMALYSATNGASWTKKTNWGSEEPVGEWFGVSTDENGNVTQLILNSNGLTGKIPSELGNLSRLTNLSLYNNSLSGTIPAQLGQLTNLQTVFLFGNQLSGTIPAELGKLANLLILELSSNRLNGAIPAQLGSLTNLQALDLRDNSLSGAIPAELGNLGRLTNLFLANNSLNGCIPAALRNVAQNDLSSLNLPFCAV